MQLPHTSVTAPACKASCRRGAACCGAVPRLVAPPAPLTASVAAWSTVRRHGCSARRPSAPPGAGRSCGSLVPQAVAAPAQHFRRQQQQQLGGGRGSSCRDGCYCCATAARAASGAGCSTSSGSGSGSSSGSSSFGLSRVRHGRLQHGSGPRRRSQEPRRAAHTAAGGGKGPNDSGPADAHRDPDLDPGELDELMYELYCSSGGSSSGLDDVSCSQLPHYCGPLELREVPGAGVGVYVREDVAAGTLLLLATHPLALLRSGPGGGQPSSLDLAAALSRGALPPLAATWLTCLADGGGGGAGGGGGGRRRLLQLRSLFQQPFNAAAAAMPPQPPGAAAAGGSSSSGAAAAAAAAAVACPLPPDAVVAVVAYNAYGEQRPDPVLTRMRAAAQQGGLGEREGEGAVGQGAEAAAVEAEAAVGGCVGLWPAFSLINHSCAPVASYGLVGDVMVVRAAADLSAGQQVTISYSGRRTLAPLAARRAYLLQHYGFLCACERCRLEAGGGAGAEEADGGGAGTAQEQQQEQAGGSSGVRRLLLPPELPDYLEGLHTTCGRMVGPHLAALLSGRRWRDLPATAATATAANAAAAATAAAADGTGAQQPWAGAGAGAGAGRNELLGESVGDIVMELQQLSGYLSQCWQQVLRAAASAGAGGAAAAAAAQEGVAGTDAGADAAGASGGEGEGEGEGQGEGLTEREVLWLEGGVFVLLDQLMTVAAAAGLLQRIAAEPLLQLQPAAAAEAVAAAVAVAVEAPAAASAVTGDAVAGEAAAGPAKGRRRRKGAEAGAGGAAAPAPPLSAPLAVQALAARRWRVEELPPPYLQTYVDLLAQASDVAGAVAPGSDLTTALAVRLLAAVAAAAGAESEAYREAELRCYDTLSTKYGVLDYDTYEQLLAACCHRYGAQYVRLPGLDPDSVAAPGAAARAAAGAEGEGGGSGGGSRQQRGGVAAGDVAAGGDGEGSGGGLAGLPVQAVEVEAEVVLD